MLGASHIRFVIDPMASYVLCPLVLTLAAAATVWIGTGPIRRASIIEMIGE
jgi:putative ABC transport system permease protein